MKLNIKHFLVILSVVIVSILSVHSVSQPLTFSDSAKFADVARSIISGQGFESSFNFWGTINSQWIQPVMPYSIVVFFRIMGINDFAVLATSLFYFILSLIFVLLLAQQIYKDKLVSILSTAAVGFNYNLINYAISGASESPFIFEILAGTYFLSLKKWWGNTFGVIFMVLMYLTRPQAIIYILGLVLFYFLYNYSWKKGALYSLVTFVVGIILYSLYSRQGVIAVTQNLPGMPASDSLRGAFVDFDLIILIKKVFYNLYNFYKALPDIASPYMWTLFTIGLFYWSKDKLNNSFKVSVLFMVLATFLVTALTIPFYRYLHPVVPLVYIVAVATLVQFINKFITDGLGITKQNFITFTSSFLILFFVVGQTLGIIFLDSRFERKTKNVDKPPVYVIQSTTLKEITDKNDVIVTNLDTWGSWYGERKTVWFPLEPTMLQSSSTQIDAIYLTSYKIDDENYYMGEGWREIFNNPTNQTILTDFRFAGEYEFKAGDNYEKEDGRAVLLLRDK